MATIFKTFRNNDIVSTRTLLHEAIPITGTILTGTYVEGWGAGPGGRASTLTNVKNYSHGMFQSVYDYPYLSSSANHLFDITLGYSTGSALSGTTDTTVQQAKKINLYSQMAQVLMGHNKDGTILQFDEDGNVTSGGTKITECFFLNFSRLLTKDEIKKGSFTLKLGGNRYWPIPHGPSTNPRSIMTITDAGAATNFRVNSPAGEYGILSASVTGAYSASAGPVGKCGLIFYQAGIAVITSSVFLGSSATATGKLQTDALFSSSLKDYHQSIDTLLTGTSISGCADEFRRRINDISFNNTTELNSTIHFCRINNNEFNYSSNQTYVSSSKIVVKNNTMDTPVSYITTIGLYSADNELLAVAKLSEPLKKDPSNELTLRVRLDY
jgi:hypothetical protein